LALTLIGIGRIESMPDWEGTTSVFFEEAYNDERPRGGVQCHGGRDGHGRDADRGPAGVDGGRPRRGLGGGGGVGDDVREGRDRALQSGGNTMVVVTYVQETWYLIDDPNSEPDEDFVLVPLSTESRRDKYVGRLKSLSGYEYLTDVSEIRCLLQTRDSHIVRAL
jgi:hypothetical protein